MLPVRCYTCNFVLGALEDRWHELERAGYTPLERFEALHVRRMCCRKILLTYVDMSEIQRDWHRANAHNPASVHSDCITTFTCADWPAKNTPEYEACTSVNAVASMSETEPRPRPGQKRTLFFPPRVQDAGPWLLCGIGPPPTTSSGGAPPPAKRPRVAKRDPLDAR